MSHRATKNGILSDRSLFFVVLVQDDFGGCVGSRCRLCSAKRTFIFWYWDWWHVGDGTAFGWRVFIWWCFGLLRFYYFYLLGVCYYFCLLVAGVNAREGLIWQLFCWFLTLSAKEILVTRFLQLRIWCAIASRAQKVVVSWLIILIFITK